MTNYWQEELIAREHYKDLLHDAEQERLVRLASAGVSTGHAWQRKTMEYLGRLMVKWGLILQHHSGTASITPLPQLFDRTV